MFKLYKRKGECEARPLLPGENLAILLAHNISVSVYDRERFETEPPGMVCRNPNQPTDQWYCSKAAFDEGYGEAPPTIEKGNEIAVSLHTQVKVRLTAKAADDIYQKYGYSPWMADGEGFVRMPLWVLAAEFGEKLAPHNDPIVKNNTLFLT